jgi:hypothetical protein
MINSKFANIPALNQSHISDHVYDARLEVIMFSGVNISVRNQMLWTYAPEVLGIAL